MSQQIARQTEIKSGLVTCQRQIQSLLKNKEKTAQFMAGALVVANSKALSQCTPESIVQGLVGIALSDLNIDPNIGHCYLVPYWSPNGSTAQLQIGYKGFIQLLFRAGWMVKAIPVYYCDKFTMQFDGWENKVAMEQNIGDREEGNNDWVFDNLRGVYVVARHAETKDEYNLFVSKQVIEKLRLNSPNQRANKNTNTEDKKRLNDGRPVGIWADWYIEMSQSKAIKKLARLLPIGDKRLQSALVADDKAEIGETVNYATFADKGIIDGKKSVLETITDELNEPKKDDSWD